MIPREQIEKKKRRALAGLVIGLAVGGWGTFQSDGERDLVNQIIGAYVLTPLFFALIGGGVQGFKALFVKSS